MVCMTQKKKPEKNDRHLHPKMTVRLGPAAEAFLREVRSKEDRTYTAILIRALKLYAKENGYAWPESQ
jgi:hypothetical protein